MRSNVVAPIAAGILLAVAGNATAGTKTTTFNVNATVAANCNVSAGNLGFGTYDASTDLTGSADIDVRCSNGTLYRVKLSTGGGTYAQRLLANGASTLQYNLFTASNLSSVWGDGTGSTLFNSGTGQGMSIGKENTHTVYGSLLNSAANQDAPVGSYTDTITVTVEY